MVNIYYFAFYLVFKLLGNPLKRNSNDVFASYSLVFLVFIIHTLILSIVLKQVCDINFLPKMNKMVFGIIVTVIFYTVNYYLLEKNNRYVEILKRIRDAPSENKRITTVLLIFYILLPLILKILN